MGADRTAARELSGPERRPASPALLDRSPSVQRSADGLQQRLGNQGVSQFVARAVQREALTVSSPHDPAEREAVTTAAAVMRMPASSIARAPAGSSPAMVHRCACGSGAPCGCQGGELQREAAPSAPSQPAAAAPSVTSEIRGSLSGGSPLPGNVRTFMEPRFGADFSGVRVHTDAHAADLSAGVNANAFTVGQHVFFGRGQYQPETPAGQQLIAHELTHTVQQGASPLKVQRESKSWWEEFTDFTEDFIWGVVRRIAPSLEPIIRGGASGVLEWMKDKATAALGKIFDFVMAPVRLVQGIGDRMSALFAPMVAAVQVALVKISNNDCSPIREAAEKLEQLAMKVVTPIVEFVQPVIAKIKQFFSAVWDKIGAPIWEWIKQYAADQWRMVQQIIDWVTAAAKWIWEKTSVIRSIAERAWNWLKRQLGFGGEDGEGGILNWVKRKLGEAWDWLKAKIEPFKREILTVAAVVGGILLAVSPAGPIIAVGAAVAGAVQGLRWIAANWGKGDAFVRARQYLQQNLFPQLTNAAQQLAGAIKRVANAISSALGQFAASMTRMVGAVAGSMLSFLVSAVQWLADQAVKLAAWAQGLLDQLAVWMASALDQLRGFLNKMLLFLRKVAGVVMDIWSLPALLGEAIWNWIPACIRDPIVDFIGPIILRQIEIFQELAKDNEAWQKTKADIGRILKLVFKDHDLMGAVKATFHLILRVFNVPPSLLATIWQKAMAAWDTISKKPLEFIKNTVRSIGHGFKLLWDNIWDHLEFGLKGWLMGELAEKKITPPASWTDPKDVFNFVLDVLGLSVDHIFELLAKRFNPNSVAKARVWFGRISRAVDWINKAIDTSKSPAENARGIVDQAKTFAGSILSGIAEWVAGKIAEELAVMAAAAAASGGLSEVLDILRRIYRAILTAVRWARRILDMVNQTLDSVLDIAAGAVEKVGAQFEQIMHRGMPVVIGFLADQVGLGGIGAAIRNTIDKLREQVDKAILWLIDKIKAGLEALINLVQAGVEAILDWWKERKSFRAVDGQDHELFFEGTEDNARMMIASDKKPVDRFLAEYDDKESEEYKNAKRVYDQAQPIIYSTARKDAAERERRRDIVKSELAKISAAFARLAPEMPREGDYPESKMAKAVSSGEGGRPVHNIVEHLCDPAKEGTPPEGQQAAAPTVGWPKVMDWGLTEQADGWVQMHVVSAALGGRGSRQNLVPAPNSVNTGPFLQLERKTLQSLSSRQGRVRPVMWYDVKVSWHSGQYKDFAASITGQAGLYLWKGRTEKWKKNESPSLFASASIPRPAAQRAGKVSLNFSGKSDLQQVTSAAIARLIYENRPYASIGAFVTTVNEAAKNSRLGDIADELRAIAANEQVVLRDLAPR